MWYRKSNFLLKCILTNVWNPCCSLHIHLLIHWSVFKGSEHISLINLLWITWLILQIFNMNAKTYFFTFNSCTTSYLIVTLTLNWWTKNSLLYLYSVCGKGVLGIMLERHRMYAVPVWLLGHNTSHIHEHMCSISTWTFVNRYAIEMHTNNSFMHSHSHLFIHIFTPPFIHLSTHSLSTCPLRLSLFVRKPNYCSNRVKY